MGPNAQGPESLVGQVVAGYRLERMLGIGATGAVFLGSRLEGTPALEEKTGAMPVERPDQVAIKLLILPWQLTPAERADFRARFLRESQTLQRLSHPNILSVLNSGEDAASGFSYIVLPYVSGGTLATSMAARVGLAPIPFTEVASFLNQLAGALDYAHSQGIVHRDIKPANILLNEQGKPYLSDFSIVRLLAETTTRLTTTGRVMGTPAYMSPEQVTGAAVGPATDIYSLGMVVYELVTGKTAFDATTLMDLIRQQVQGKPPSPRQLRPGLPEAAEAAILCALAKNPAERFGTAADFAEAFSKGLHGQWTPELTAFVSDLSAPDFPAERTAVNVPPPGQAIIASQRGRSPSTAALLIAALGLFLACSVVLAVGAGSGTLNLAALFHSIAGTSTPSSSPIVLSSTATPTTTSHHNGNTPSPISSPIVRGGPTATPVPGATSTPTSPPTPTDTPVPPPTPTNTPVPPPPQTIQIGWSGAHPTWIWMTFNNFPTGTYTYYCTFSTPPQSFPFRIVETTEPETWDNGKTCYDTQAGDHVWVTVNGVSSNTLTVP